MLPREGYDLVAIVPLRGPEQHLDLEILAAFLRVAGFRILLLDSWLHGLSVADAMEAALRERPSVIYWHISSRRQLQAVAEVLGQPTGAGHPLQIAGGYFSSRHDGAILSFLGGLGAIVRGELERPVADLLRTLVRGEPWSATLGLTIRRGDVSVRNLPGPLLEDLDALPMAASDLFHDGRLRSGQRVLLNRGCDSNCSYCGLQVPYRDAFGSRVRFWRSRSPRKIADEIEYYVTRHGVRRFLFEAFVFFGYDGHGESVVVGLAEEIERRKLDIEFSVVTHPRALARNEHLLPRLRSVGLRGLLLGIDSGLERALRQFRIEFGVSDILSALAALHRHGIPFDIGFFFFDPWMTFAEIREQLAFLRRIRPFFGHLPRSYFFFLDQQLLGSALRLNSGMPLLAELAAEGLLVPADPLVGDPAARFADPRAGQFYAIHRGLRNSESYRTVRRQLLSSARLPAALEDIPLVAAEDLWDLLAERPGMDVEEATRVAEARLSERLRSAPGEAGKALGEPSKLLFHQANL